MGATQPTSTPYRLQRHELRATGGAAAYSYFPGTYENGVLGVNFLVERGKRYAFGVSFESWITLDVRERDERTPYAPRPTDQIQLEVHFGGSAMQMTVDTTAVYQA